MFIGIGSIAWLFNISKPQQQQPQGKPKPTIPKKPVHLTGISRNRTISNEELNAGLTTPFPLSEKPSTELERPARPFPPPHKPLEWGDVTQKPADPTLDYSILLIAKPLPFKFDMAPRDAERACRIRELYAEEVQKGQFAKAREYWGANQGRGESLGWSKV
jgi:hypothetical protein